LPLALELLDKGSMTLFAGRELLARIDTESCCRHANFLPGDLNEYLHYAVIVACIKSPVKGAASIDEYPSPSRPGMCYGLGSYDIFEAAVRVSALLFIMAQKPW
jgi:hypothetical protein